jgi:hypothetical protein
VVLEGVKINGEKYMTIDSTADALKAKKVPMDPTIHEQGDEY